MEANYVRNCDVMSDDELEKTADVILQLNEMEDDLLKDKDE